MTNVSRLDPGHRLGGLHAPRPQLGRPGHRRGQNDRHLLQAELPGAAAQARECEFFADGEEARAAGYRPCLRCKPDEVGRDREAVAQAVKLIEQAEEAPTLAELAAAVGYAPHHFQRLFKRDLGVSPAEYARGAAQPARARRRSRPMAE